MSSANPMIIVQVHKDDTELLTAVSETFGQEAKPISARGFDGSLMDMVQVALPVISATAPFLLKYFTAKNVNKKGKRVVLGPRGAITLEGYDRADVSELLDKIRS